MGSMSRDVKERPEHLPCFDFWRIVSLDDLFHNEKTVSRRKWRKHPTWEAKFSTLSAAVKVALTQFRSVLWPCQRAPPREPLWKSHTRS